MNITNILRKSQNWKIACNYQYKHMDDKDTLPSLSICDMNATDFLS